MSAVAAMADTAAMPTFDCRQTFAEELIALADADPRIVAVCNDSVGSSGLGEFQKKFPDRLVNVGIAEQNMVGVAAGLAMAGKTVFTYTIGNFSFMRCMEQVRNEVCYHNLNVKIVAVGGGFAYGALGYSHHAIEDIAMLRVLPNLTIIAPGDPVETTLATRGLCAAKGPAYLRLGRGGEPVVHSTEPSFALGKAIVLCQGSDATLVTSAATLDIAQDAATQLHAAGLSIGLISTPTLVPFDRDAVLAAAGRSALLVTVEEHGKGGLASIVAETLTDACCPTRLRSLYIQKPPAKEAGDRGWQRQYHGLTTDAIKALIQ